jgi:hypothetical protein
MLKSCPNLKYIGVLATGFNVVDPQTLLYRTCSNQYSYIWNNGLLHNSPLRGFLSYVTCGEHASSVKQVNGQNCEIFATGTIHW